MKENLNYETGDSWCYDNNPSNCDTFGRLYNGQTALEACPSGWRLPSDDDWKMLEGTVDSRYGIGNYEWFGYNWRGYDAGNNLKSKNFWYSSGNGIDVYGFTALPAGYKFQIVHFNGIGKCAYFWSSTEINSLVALYRSLLFNYEKVCRDNHENTRGYSVRCIKD